ncbi:nucleoside-diphosphate sugar epimerase [Streptomyces griseocarneus]|nr:nucleoside-diphosphate sugar epimerase [Streptomyces griseocarneus]
MILVTGATGHLGANLVRRLLRDGEDVRVLLRGDVHARTPALDGLAVQRVGGDVRDARSVARAVDGCDRVFHCAALKSPADGGKREIHRTNVVGTRNVLDAALRHGTERVVVTGSFGATGETRGRPSTEDVPYDPFRRHTPYATSKAFAEHECLRAAAAGLDVVIAASTAIVGPHDYGPSRAGRALLDFAHGRLLAYPPGGFEFVSVDDLVEGHLLAMRHGRPGRKYLLSTRFMTMDALMDLFAAVTGRPRPPLRVPGPLMAGAAEVLHGLARTVAPHREPRFSPAAVRFLRAERKADCSRARAELGYRPTSVATAVEQAHACFARRGLLPGRHPRVVPPRGPSSTPLPAAAAQRLPKEEP